MIDHISKYLDVNRGLKLGQTAADLIYENLRESILGRKLAPNERIKIREISSFLGVSQTPVREAIQRLAAEKFITVTAHSEVRVIDLNIEESRSLGELVEILDLSVMKKIYKTVSDDFIDQLGTMTEKMGAHYAANKIKSYIEQNIAIHKAVWKLHNNEVIIRVLIQSLERMHLVERHYMSYFLDPKFLERSWQDHREFVEAIAAREWPRIEKIILRHWQYPK